MDAEVVSDEAVVLVLDSAAQGKIFNFETENNPIYALRIFYRFFR